MRYFRFMMDQHCCIEILELPTMSYASVNSALPLQPTINIKLSYLVLTAIHGILALLLLYMECMVMLCLKVFWQTRAKILLLSLFTMASSRILLGK